MTQLSDNELIQYRIEVDRELARRGIILSVGEIGETLVIAHFNSTAGLPTLLAAPKGAKNVDAISKDGDRYSIKSTQKAKKTGTVYPDSKDPDKQLFEYLLIVKISEDFRLKAIHRFTWGQFLKVRAWDKRMNAWYVPVSLNRLEIGENLFSEK